MRDLKGKLKPLVNLRNLLILIPIAIISLANKECKNGSIPDYEWYPKLYATDSQTLTISRGEEIIMCEDPQFDTMICMPIGDIIEAKRAYFKAVNQCKTWKSNAAKREVYELGDRIDQDLR